MTQPDAAELIARLDLTRHPEGGWFRETYRSSENIPATALPERFNGSRALSTAIYFMLERGDFSALCTKLGPMNSGTITWALPCLSISLLPTATIALSNWERTLLRVTASRSWFRSGPGLVQSWRQGERPSPWWGVSWRQVSTSAISLWRTGRVYARHIPAMPLWCAG